MELAGWEADTISTLGMIMVWNSVISFSWNLDHLNINFKVELKDLGLKRLLRILLSKSSLAYDAIFVPSFFAVYKIKIMFS
jgi:hypothetical protein